MLWAWVTKLLCKLQINKLEPVFISMSLPSITVCYLITRDEQSGYHNNRTSDKPSLHCFYLHSFHCKPNRIRSPSLRISVLSLASLLDDLIPSFINVPYFEPVSVSETTGSLVGFPWTNKIIQSYQIMYNALLLPLFPVFWLADLLQILNIMIFPPHVWSSLSTSSGLIFYRFHSSNFVRSPTKSM